MMFKFVGFPLIIAGLVSCSGGHYDKGPENVPEVLVVEDIQLEEKKEEYPSGFLSRDEVLKELQAYENKSFVEKPLDAEAKEREKLLIPMDKFLDGVPKKEKSVDRPIPADVPSEVVHLDFLGPVRNQTRGDCTAFAGTSAMNAVMNTQAKRTLAPLSEWDAWDKYRQYSSIAFTRALTQEKNKIGDYADYPIGGPRKSSIKPHAYISKFRYLGDSQGDIVEEILKGNHLYIAMRTPNSMVACDKSGVINPNSTASSGGHAIHVVGYMLDAQKKLILVLKNSWGTKCGKGGFQYLPFTAICKRSPFYCDLWAVQEVTSTNGLPPAPGPLPVPVPEPVPTPPVLPQPEPGKFMWKCVHLGWENGKPKLSCKRVPVE